MKLRFAIIMDGNKPIGIWTVGAGQFEHFYIRGMESLLIDFEDVYKAEINTETKERAFWDYWTAHTKYSSSRGGIGVVGPYEVEEPIKVAAEFGAKWIGSLPMLVQHVKKDNLKPWIGV